MRQLRVLKDGFHKALVPLINQSDYIDVAVLAAGVKEDFTIPDDAGTVMFSSTESFWCQIGPSASAAIPTVDITDGSGSELNPKAREVFAGETISLIAPYACIVMLAFYK